MSGIARVIALGLPPILAKGLTEGGKPSSQMKIMQLTKKPGRKPKTQISMVSPDFSPGGFAVRRAAFEKESQQENRGVMRLA